jgi:succinate dehydrogenase hydrophobic membrane anchor protein
MGIMSKGLGVKHWVFQRVSNALFVVFGAFLAYTLVTGVSYESLQALMSDTLVKVYLAVTLAFAFANSILAAWQIEGDYAKKFHIPKGVIVGIAVIGSIAYLVFGLSLIF